MVVTVETPRERTARKPAGRVSRAPANATPPRPDLTSFSREYMEYWAPLLQSEHATER